MLRTQLCDVLRFRRADAGCLDLELSAYTARSLRRSFPLDDSNLIQRAAAALRRHTDVNVGASITVHKRIPSQAGLAGGSSNAATTLLGLNQLWNLNLPREELHHIAATLGSDVNFFVEDCRAAVCRGRGELVSPVSLHGEFHFVAARPLTGNSTPEVFSQLHLPTETVECRPIVDALFSGSAAELSARAFNRLTEPAEQINADMKSLRHDMRQRTGCPVFMSGSGSTCFVIARSHREARRFASRLQTRGREILTPLRSF